MDSVSLILSLLCSLLCCLFWFVVILAVIGAVVLRKKGKKKISPKEAIQMGADVSRAWVRGEKTREQLLAEAELDDED